MPPTSEMPSDERLVEATVTLLTDKTFAEITGDDIATAAGVDRTLINHYFGSIGGLFSVATAQMVRSSYLTGLGFFQESQRTSSTLDEHLINVALMDANIDYAQRRHLAKLIIVKLVEARSNDFTRRVVAEAIDEIVQLIAQVSHDGLRRGWVSTELPLDIYPYFQFANSVTLLTEVPHDPRMPTSRDLFRFASLLEFPRQLELRAMASLESVLDELPVIPVSAPRAFTSAREVERQRRVNRIIEAAATIVNESGPLAVRVRDIATMADESVGTIYRLVGDRRHILIAVGEQRLQTLLTRIQDSIVHCASSCATSAQRLECFSAFRWDFVELLALHDPEHDFNIFDSPVYRQAVHLAARLIGSETVPHLDDFAETLWLIQALAEIGSVELNIDNEVKFISTVEHFLLH